MSDERTSNCCLDVDVDFYWAYCGGKTLEEHIDAAVDVLWRVIAKPGERGWSPPAREMALAEFRDRLRLAARGGLKPREDVKPLRQGVPPLFEIRWQGISVVELDADRKPKEFREILVRLIHAEPDELGLCAVGLHAHEKPVYADETAATKRQQDDEIDEAVRLYFAGVGEVWGLTRREVVGDAS